MHLGPYELERELGRGGMGVVWRARDPSLDRPVAIKVLLAGLAGAEDLARLRREAQAQARLRHPGIAAVHALGATPTGQPYLVMDLVEGESLRARLTRDGPLPPAEAAALVARLARAVAYAHARGVLHRDLKARNVLLDPTGEPVLIDFGLAALPGRERLTTTGELMGTPAWMAPEQVRGDRSRVGPKTDVHGLGAVLYEVLTGKPPFAGTDLVDLLRAVEHDAPAPPSRLRPGLDPRLDAVTLRCLEKDPARRWPSAEAVAEALEALAAPRARRAGPPAAGLALGGLALGALAGLALGRGTAPGGAAAGPAAAGPAPVTTAAGPAPAEAGAATPATEPPGAAAWAALVGGDEARAAALADEALAGAPAEGLARALLVRAAGSPAADAARSLADVAAAEALSRDPEVHLRAAAFRALLCDGDPALFAGLADLWRRADPATRLEAARIGAFVAAPGVGAALDELVAQGQPRALGLRALARVDAGQEGALADAEAALARDPRCVEALLARFQLRRQGEDLEAAVASAEARTDRLALSRALAMRGVHRVAGARGDLAVRAAGLEDLELALTLAPGFRAALLQRATVRLAALPVEAAARRATLDAALADVERLAAAPGDPRAWLVLRGQARQARALDVEAGLDAEAAARADADFTAWVALDPGRPEPWYQRAMARLVAGDLERAEADALAALSRGLEARARETAVAVVARARWRRGRAREALAGLDEFLAGRDPARPAYEALAERALVRAQLRDAAGARADAEAACRRPRPLPDAHLARSRALVVGARSEADLERAAEALDAALALDPTLGLALLDRGALRVRAGRRREGRDDVERAARLEPWEPAHLVTRAFLRQAEGDPAGAEADLERALALDPQSGLARLHRARARLARGDEDGAVVDLEVARERDAWRPDALGLLAQVRLARGDQDRARALAEQALALVGDGPVAARPLGVLAAGALARGDLVAARDLADRAVAADEAEADGWAVRARVRARAGDARGAVADLDAALERAAGRPDLRLERADALARLGERARAEADLRAVVAALPAEHPLAVRARGLLAAPPR